MCRERILGKGTDQVFILADLMLVLYCVSVVFLHYVRVRFGRCAVRGIWNVF